MDLVLATVTPGEPEIFSSIQGEGVSAGTPCVFIRLSRCNLACEWCDTAYTWHFDGDDRPHRSGETFERKANQVKLSPGEAAARISTFGPNRLVITGGEPMLQAKALAAMLDVLPGYYVEVETNGTTAPPPEFDAKVNQYNVSPKLSHSGNPADLALLPERMRAWADDERAYLKFVVAEPGHVVEALELCERHGIPLARTWMMPEGTDAATLKLREEWLAPLCQLHGVSMTRRLHIEMFGDTRGT